MADFDVQGARKAGYSDKEIADHLASTNKFDAEAARKSGYGDKDIIEHLTPGPGMVRRAASAVGDALKTADDWATTRAANAAGGLVSLPGVAAQGADWLGRKIGIDPSWLGPQYAKILEAMKEHPTAQQISGDFLTRINKKPVNLEGNVPGGKIIDTATEGALSALATGGTSLPAVLAGTLGGGVSEIAGQVAQQVAPDYENLARVGGGLVGGVSGAVIPSVVRRGGQIAKAIAEPLTAKGRDAIVGRTMFNVADDPATAITNMDRYVQGRAAYPTSTPGFNLTASKAAGDDALMATENALDRAGAGFGEIKNANNVALTNALNALDQGMDPRAFVAEIARVDAGAAMRAQAAIDALPRGADAATAGTAIRNSLFTRSEALQAARSRATDPLYAEARAFPEDLRIGNVFQRVDDFIANSKGDINTAARRARSFLFNDRGQPDWSASGMMNARAAVDDMLKTVEPGSNQQRILMGIREEMNSSLSGVPAERQARQTFADMSRPLDPFDPKKGAPNVGKVVETDRFGSNWLAPEKVPAMFFRPGDAGAATMNEFLTANAGNQTAIDAMRNFIAGKAREAPDVKAFLLKNRQAIETLDPALARRLEDAAATSSISQGFKASPAGKFLDQDLDAAIRSTLGAPDSANRMRALTLSAGSDPAAVQGLQAAILGDFRRSVGAPVAEGGGTPLLTAAGASKWLEANRATVAGVLTPDQVAGLEAITRALKDQGQTARAVAGSDTAKNLATRSLLEAIPYGNAAWLGGMRKLLSIPLGTADGLVMQRLIEVMRDPQVAAALMKKATPGNAKMIEPLLQSFAKGTALPALTAGGRESP